MKLKHIIPALFGLSACFACSSMNPVNNNKTNITPQTDGGINDNVDNLTITFDLNGGKYLGLPTFKLENVEFTSYWKYVAERAPGSTGKPIEDYQYHNFKGYSLNKDDSTNLIDDKYIVKSDMTVYAQYELDSTKDCTVEWNDGSTLLDSEDYVVGETPSFKGQIPIKTDKYFTGWDPVPAPITQIQADIGVVQYNAVYADIITYHTVTFDSKEGSKVVSQNIIEGQHATEPAAPIKAGYKFLNWYEDGKTPTTSFDFLNTPINEDITLCANWENELYTVTWYDEDMTTILTKKVDYTYKQKLVIPDKSLTPGKFEGSNRYLFNRWSPYAYSSTEVVKNMEFYAVYERNNDIRFTFEGYGCTIEGIERFEERYVYSEVFSFSFDRKEGANPYPLSLNVYVKIDNVDLPSTAYSYDETTGVITFDTTDVAIRNAKTISLEAGNN